MSQESDQGKNEIRPVFITYPTLYSLLMLNYLVNVRNIKFAGVILSIAHIKRMAINFSYLESAYILMKKSGLSYVLYMMLNTKCAYFITAAWWVAGLFTGKRRLFKTFGQLLKDHRIPVLKSADINGEEAFHFMKGVDANLIVSSYNNQILRYRTCKKFRYGAVGIHNSYLPDFSGLDAAFEGLYQGVKETGVTAHLIDKGIDTGKIVYQEKIRIKPGDTVFSLNIRQWLRGAQLIPQVLDWFREGPVSTREQDPGKAKYPYESYPKRDKVREFMRNGKRCIRMRDIFMIDPFLIEFFPSKY
ncbi:MAG: hypothetical protein JW847_00675 [Candidatus Omnitrophica bacterium]|nr:hypothetical protein [Candidatus Omnitrophota bacterium]